MTDQSFLTDFLARSADGAYVVDANQRIVAWNDAAETLLGFSEQDVLGQPCHQIIGGRADGGCVICRRGCQPFAASQRGELVPSFDVQVRTAHGMSRWVNAGVICIDIPDESGDTSPAVIHLLRDVEAKKRAESFAADVATLSRQFNPALVSSESEQNVSLPLTPLTPREFDVLRLMSDGLDTGAIASQLLIGKNTVRNHIQRIMHKLDAHTRLEAVTCARDLHLLE